MVTIVVLLGVFGTAIWVDQDARKLMAAGASKSQLGNSPLTWGIATILVWIIVFPWYLLKRRDIRRELGIASGPTTLVHKAVAAPPSGPLPDLGWFTDPTNALQERYWNGQAWTEQIRVAPPTT
ncbi:MAG TPA: DUF2510 domain-containing protein [Acidimicrobiales bacterium]